MSVETELNELEKRLNACYTTLDQLPPNGVVELDAGRFRAVLTLLNDKLDELRHAYFLFEKAYADLKGKHRGWLAVALIILTVNGITVLSFIGRQFVPLSLISLIVGLLAGYAIAWARGLLK